MLKLCVLVIATVLLGMKCSAAEITAADCAGVDLKNRMNPPRNQRTSEYCYAFTAADLLGFKIGIKPPAELSVLSMASHYISMNPDEVAKARAAIINTKAPEGATFFGGDPYKRDYDQSQKPIAQRYAGYIDMMLSEYSGEKSLCLESDIPSELSGKAYNDPDESNFFVRQLSMAASPFYTQLEMQEYKENQLHPGCHNGQTSVDQLRNTSSALNDFAARKIRETLDKRCRHPVPNKKYVVHTAELLNPLGTDIDVSNLQKAHTLLALIDKKQPIGIGYDPSAVYDHNPGGSHASTVIGKRWNGHSCEVEIRNSYGTKCDGKRANVECEDGYWWIDVTQLAPALTQAVWVE